MQQNEVTAPSHCEDRDIENYLFPGGRLEHALLPKRVHMENCEECMARAHRLRDEYDVRMRGIFQPTPSEAQSNFIDRLLALARIRQPLTHVSRGLAQSSADFGH